jgi:hypothetical protein
VNLWRQILSLDAYRFPRGVDVELAILFEPALIVVLLARILFVASLRRAVASHSGGNGIDGGERQ